MEDRIHFERTTQEKANGTAFGETKPRILIIDNSVDLTGAISSILRNAWNLRESFDFEFILPVRSRATEVVENSGIGKVHEMPLLELSRRWRDWLFYLPMIIRNALSLRKLIAARSISMVHGNDIYNLLPVTLRFMGVGIPYITHVRFMPERFPAWLFNFWLRVHLRYSKKVIVVSKSLYNKIRKHQKIEVIFDELPLRKEKSTVSNHASRLSGPVFLYLSNFIQGKGQDFALKAFAKVVDELPGWRLRFVGGDMGLKKNMKYRESLKFEAQRLGIDARTEFIGFTSDVETEYMAADIVLNFSESESLSMTTLEALYFGRPVIVTDCGGPAEVVNSDSTGLVVPNRDVNAMSLAMLRLAKDAGLGERLGRAGQTDVTKRFGGEQTSNSLKSVYNEAIKAR